MRYIVLSLALLLFACKAAQTPTPEYDPYFHYQRSKIATMEAISWWSRYNATREAERWAIEELLQKTWDAQENVVTRPKTPIPTSTVPSYTSAQAQDVVPFDFTAPPTSCPEGCIVVPYCVVVIKGNVSFDGQEKIYHMPDQKYYLETVINPRLGERWFCTEEEALANGWRKSKE